MATVFTDAGKAITTNRVKGSGTEPAYLGIGTGAGTAGVTDTTLFTEVETRVLGTSTRQTTTVTNDTYRVATTITLASARAITNAGTFDAITTGNCMVKGDFSVINLDAGDSITITANLKYA